MEENKCVSCIKDGVTGQCFDIKDKTAREQIEGLQEQINNLPTGGGGDTSEIQQEIDNLEANLKNCGVDFQYTSDDAFEVMSDTERIACNGGLDGTGCRTWQNFRVLSGYAPNKLPIFVTYPVAYTLAIEHNNLLEKVKVNTSNIEQVTTSLNEVIDTVNNIPTGGLTLKSEVFTGTFGELVNRISALSSKILEIIFVPAEHISATRYSYYYYPDKTENKWVRQNVGETLLGKGYSFHFTPSYIEPTSGSLEFRCTKGPKTTLVFKNLNGGISFYHNESYIQFYSATDTSTNYIAHSSANVTCSKDIATSTKFSNITLYYFE